MIANLIDISQLDSDQVKHALWPYDLREVLDQMAETLPALIEDKPILFERDYDRELPLIVSHREKLRQILGHLLDNAAKFTESGKISLRACARDEGVEIAVEDTGIGIDAAHQEIIFDGFRQVDDEDNRRYDGMGSASIHRVSGSPGLALPLVSTAVPVLARVSGFGCLIEDRSSSRPPVRAARALSGLPIASLPAQHPASQLCTSDRQNPKRPSKLRHRGAMLRWRSC